MRLFFALWPDENTRAQLAELQRELKGRKTRRENLHMTLAFLGEQPEACLPSLQSLLHELTVPKIDLLIDRIGYFSRQRIAWAGMQHVPESLLLMQRELSTALEQSGIAFDRRKQFKPHITLARDAVPPGAINFAPFPWHACQVSLLQSVMDSTGVSYRVLASQYCSADLEAKEEPR